MLYRIETGPRAGLDDSQGRSTAQYIESSLGLKVSAVNVHVAGVAFDK